MKKYLKLFAAVFMSLFFSQMVLAQTDSQLTIVAAAMRDRDLTTFVKAIKAAGLVDTLKGTGPYTVFAPTNAAFDKLPKDVLDNLMKDKAKLNAILMYHVVPGKIMAVDIQNGPLNSLQGQAVTLAKTPSGGVQVNNATVTKPDVQAANGVIHEIDTVLIPSNVNLNQPGMNNMGPTPNPSGTTDQNVPVNTPPTDQNQNTGYMNGDQTSPSNQPNQ